MKSSTQYRRIVFTQGGKGGVAKTEVVLSLVSWYRARGICPVLFDFDIENQTKSGLQSFYPEARKFDVHTDGALDEFFALIDKNEGEIILADLGAGAGRSTFQWFDDTYDYANELLLKFTSIGVTTNDAGAVQSILTWGKHLADRVDYVIVLNELRERETPFEYWYQNEAANRFMSERQPVVVRMEARIEEFQSEMRNQSCTLQRVIDGEHDSPFLHKTKNIVRAKRYQRQLFEGFDCANSILLP